MIQYPDSLSSLIFKAKYFPTCDVFYAIPKSNASFTWKSIASAIELIRAGSRWRVENGMNIDVWKDNWLPRNRALRPFTPDLYNLSPFSVASLINMDTLPWDQHILHTLFWTDDIDTILQIPVLGNQRADMRIWHYTKTGTYSVRSGYPFS